MDENLWNKKKKKRTKCFMDEHEFNLALADEFEDEE